MDEEDSGGVGGRIFPYLTLLRMGIGKTVRLSAVIAGCSPGAMLRFRKSYLSHILGACDGDLTWGGGGEGAREKSWAQRYPPPFLPARAPPLSAFQEKFNSQKTKDKKTKSKKQNQQTPAKRFAFSITLSLSLSLSSEKPIFNSQLQLFLS